MECLDAHLREEFPLLSNIFLGNNHKRDMFHGFSTESYNNRLIAHNFNFPNHSLDPYNISGSSSDQDFSLVTAPAFQSFNPFSAHTDNGFGLFLKNDNPNLGQYVHRHYNIEHVVQDLNMGFRDIVAPEGNNYVMLPEGNSGVDVNNKKLPEQRKKRLQVRDKKPKPSANINDTASASKSTNIIKGQWTNQEDILLIQLVRQYGVRKWSQIAKNFNGRVGKQCRERWHNHLRPDIRKDMWSEEEDKLLVAAHREVGNKWAEIAKRLPGRTENSIKNHWNTNKRRQLSKRARFGFYGTGRNPNDMNSSSYLQNYIKSISAATPTLNMTKHLDKSRSCYDEAEYENSMDMEVEALLHCGVKKEMNLLDMFSNNGDASS